ncbi:HlyD family efflux transporter periplasmic adaptor subunit [Pirellulaceae bacterium SH501]
MDLDQRLDQLSELAATAPAAQVYFDSLVCSLCEATHAIAAAAWTVEGARYRLQAEYRLRDIGIHDQPAVMALHEQGLEEACRSTHRISQVSGRELPYRYHFCAGDFDGDAFLVLEIVMKSTASGSAEDISGGAIKAILEAFIETAREYRSQIVIQSLKEELHTIEDLEARLSRWYGSKCFDQAAFVIANELRELSGVDRVCVGRVQRGRIVMIAISGVVSFDRRAKQVALLEELMNATSRAMTRVQLPVRDPLPVELESRVDRYVDGSGVESMLLTVCKSSQTPESHRSTEKSFGVIALENFQEPKLVLSPRVERILERAESALVIAAEREDGWIFRVAGRLDQFRQRFLESKAGWVLSGLLLCFVLLLLFLVPIQREVWAEGVYECSLSRDIFVPLDAEVAEVRVDHESLVEQGDVLMVLRSRALDLRREELLTEREVALEKLRSIESSRLGDRRNRPQESAQQVDWSAAETELRELLDGQSEQLLIIDEMMKSLVLRSPIAGQVITWNSSREWLRRPVRQGQKLLSIVDLRSQGKLRLMVDDHEASVLYSSMSQSQGAAKMRFAFVSYPAQSLRAKVDHTGINADRSEGQGGAIRVEASVEADQDYLRLPGAAVRGRIECGTTSLGRLWLDRAIRQWRLWWYF